VTKLSTSTSTPSEVSNSTIWGSWRPSGASELGRALNTVLATTSWPSSQRVTSMSWTTESVIIMSVVNPGGTSALRWRQCSSSGLPTRPSSTAAFRARKPSS
jgi:hypothetical protein